MPRAPVLALLLLAGCGRDALVHGIDEGQANQILVALDEAGIHAEKQRDEGGEGTWRVEVDGADAGRAHRLLAERELPRSRPPGFGEVFGKGSMVPTPTEERALYLHALSGELARSVEAIDGVIEARVHLALPVQDPLRAEPAPPGRVYVVRTGDNLETIAIVPGSFVVHPPGELHEYINGPARTLLFRGKVLSLIAVEHLYHLEHHLYPQVPHHNWPKLARRLDPYFKAAGVTPIVLGF